MIDSFDDIVRQPVIIPLADIDIILRPPGRQGIRAEIIGIIGIAVRFLVVGLTTRRLSLLGMTKNFRAHPVGIILFGLG